MLNGAPFGSTIEPAQGHRTGYRAFQTEEEKWMPKGVDGLEARQLLRLF